MHFVYENAHFITAVKGLKHVNINLIFRNLLWVGHASNKDFKTKILFVETPDLSGVMTMKYQSVWYTISIHISFTCSQIVKETIYGSSWKFRGQEKRK